jgi:Tfp pilus assembly protein PilF
MKRYLIVALPLVLALVPPCLFAQSVQAPPVDRTEILGRLALDYSPSYIAHLVKTHGLSFSVSAAFLDQVKKAGGAGILFDNLPHSASPNSMGSEPDDSLPVEHLAKCAALIHSGNFDSAGGECHASIDESPSSPWPLLATAEVLQFAAPVLQPTDSNRALRSEQRQLEQRAAALMPPAPPSKLPTVPPGFGGFVVTEEQGVALASELLDLDEANARFTASSELMSFQNPLELMQMRDAPIPPPSLATIDISAALQRRMQIEPDLAGNHLSLAQLYDSQAHDFDNAKNEILEAVRLEPDYARPHVQLASLYLAHQDWDAGIAELREIVRIAPFGMLGRSALAHALETAGKIPNAIEEYKAILALHPENPDASDALVGLYLKQNDRNSAIEELRRSLKSTSLLLTDESLSVSLRWNDENRLAKMLEINHDPNAAIEQYLYMLRFKPDDPDLHNDYGMLLTEQHRCNDAMAEFNESIRLSDETSYPRANVALCLSMQKDYDGAARELKSILESEPNSPIAENNVAWIYAIADDPKFRNPAEALRLARLAVDSSDQPEPFMLDTLAEAQLLNGEADKAFATETQAAKLDPDNPELQSRLAHFRDSANKGSRSKSVSAVAPQPTTTLPH